MYNFVWKHFLTKHSKLPQWWSQRRSDWHSLSDQTLPYIINEFCHLVLTISISLSSFDGYIASKKSYSRCIVFYILKCFMLPFKIYLLIGILFMTPTFCGAEHPNMWPFSSTCLYVFTIYLLIRILSMTPIFCCKEQHEICGFSFLCVIVVQYIQSVCPFVPSCLFVWQNLHTKLPTKQLENNSHHIFKSASSFRSHHWKNRGKLFQIRQ